MSLYADYLKELTSDEIIETAQGFITYRYLNEGKSVYIIDIYVMPYCRKEGIASRLADRVCEEAKQKGCTEVLGTVVPTAKGCTASLKVLMAYGMSLFSASQNMIFLRKEL